MLPLGVSNNQVKNVQEIFDLIIRFIKTLFTGQIQQKWVVKCIMYLLISLSYSTEFMLMSMLGDNKTSSSYGYIDIDDMSTHG